MSRLPVGCDQAVPRYPDAFAVSLPILPPGVRAGPENGSARSPLAGRTDEAGMRGRRRRAPCCAWLVPRSFAKLVRMSPSEALLSKCYFQVIFPPACLLLPSGLYVA